jgi:hypothetical protein
MVAGCRLQVESCRLLFFGGHGPINRFARPAWISLMVTSHGPAMRRIVTRPQPRRCVIADAANFCSYPRNSRYPQFKTLG